MIRPTLLLPILTVVAAVAVSIASNLLSPLKTLTKRKKTLLIVGTILLGVATTTATTLLTQSHGPRQIEGDASKLLQNPKSDLVRFLERNNGSVARLFLFADSINVKADMPNPSFLAVESITFGCATPKDFATCRILRATTTDGQPAWSYRHGFYYLEGEFEVIGGQTGEGGLSVHVLRGVRKTIVVNNS
jgi:hypothetical protein